GHEAGQFAFVTVDASEGAHPYTIASAWDAQRRQDKRLTFVIKALGDHTRELPGRISPGTPVTVEGPYGRFTFAGEEKRQIWIGAGIGITPFIARMQALASERAEKGLPEEKIQIDLFHPVNLCPDEAREKLAADARAAGVHLHIMDSSRDERLTGEKIRARIPEWQNASVWFCGPADFGQSLRADLTTHGLPPQAFHQELFEMR
ncbi:MAG: ferric reductase, partial [Zoogloeaceae bacterium]|nr:ferric reductase [Zoogloeaceae bacterium]